MDSNVTGIDHSNDLKSLYKVVVVEYPLCYNYDFYEGNIDISDGVFFSSVGDAVREFKENSMMTTISDINVGGNKITMPSLCIIYEIIDKDSLLVNSRIKKILIGNDILHYAREINSSNLESAQKDINLIFKNRKHRLDIFANEMAKIPEDKRKNFTKQEMSILRIIFGNDGIRYISESELDVINVFDMLKYLALCTYWRNTTNINFDAFRYLDSLTGKVDSIKDLVITLRSDRTKNFEEKQEYVKTHSGEEAVQGTYLYDIREIMFDYLLTDLATKIEYPHLCHINNERINGFKFIDEGADKGYDYQLSMKINKRRQGKKEILREERK